MEVPFTPTAYLPNQAEDRYAAAMVLGAAGDALAYKNGDWEFLKRGEEIHRQLKELGGLAKLKVSALRVSDDTVMHLATARALVEAGETPGMEQIYKTFRLIAREYVECMNDMQGRAAGITCIRSAALLRPAAENGYIIPFDRAGGGCGGAMRSMCIGLRYPHPEQEAKLIAVAVESGRMTHNHPTGYLGSLASALLTAYAVRNYPPVEWGRRLVATLPKAFEYIQQMGRDVQEAKDNWDYFEDAWKKYLKRRQIDGNQTEATFPEVYGVQERDDFYREISWGGWGGSSGHDAPMIAYDAFLGCNGSWEELTNRGFFHGGDSDSTGVICGTWYGVLYVYNQVPEANYDQIEKAAELLSLGSKIFALSQKP